jgi:benzoate-CoA ligase family protein
MAFLGGAFVVRFSDLPRPFNLAAHILDGNLARGLGDRTALICPDGVYTYRDVTLLANQAGNALKELGVRQGDRLLLALSDGLEYVASWYAAVKIGAVVAEVYTFLQPKDYAYFLNYSRARVAIADHVTLPALRSVRQDCPHLETVLVVTKRASDAKLWPGEAAFEELISRSSSILEAAPTLPDDMAIWKFTTGTTGQPKAVVHCQAAPLISSENYAREVLGLQPDDRVLPVPKMFFGYARDLTTVFTFAVGACGIVFPQRSTPELLFELIRAHSPTVMVQVPTMINAMAEYAAAQRYDLSCLRFAVSSGEALPPSVHSKWMSRFGVEIVEGVGSSEAYHIYLSNQPGKVRTGSVGRLVPGYRARLLDADGSEVKVGEVGELWISGDTLGIMYWNDYLKTKATFQGEWLRTGDLFRVDEDGYFWYQGRADDLVKIGGIWVAPAEVEQCLAGHELVTECAVVGSPDEATGLSTIRAFVVLKRPELASPEVAEELRDFVKSRLSPYKYPREIIFVSSLPKTSTGKVDRRALKLLGAMGT